MQSPGTGNDARPHRVDCRAVAGGAIAAASHIRSCLVSRRASTDCIGRDQRLPSAFSLVGDSVRRHILRIRNGFRGRLVRLFRRQARISVPDIVRIWPRPGNQRTIGNGRRCMEIPFTVPVPACRHRSGLGDRSRATRPLGQMGG